jgi:hypothetical protein
MQLVVHALLSMAWFAYCARRTGRSMVIWAPLGLIVYLAVRLVAVLVLLVIIREAMDGLSTYVVVVGRLAVLVAIVFLGAGLTRRSTRPGA